MLKNITRAPRLPRAPLAPLMLLGLLIVCRAEAQTGSRDVVLLLDMSSSMNKHYQELRDYLSNFFPQNFLKNGDTVHLIPFSDRARLELSRRINGQDDIEIILARLLLMYPLSSHPNIEAALGFAEHFAASLPGTRAKSIVLISNGEPNSAVPRLEGAGAAIHAAQNTQDIIAETRIRLQSADIGFEFVMVPVPPAQNRSATRADQVMQPESAISAAVSQGSQSSSAAMSQAAVQPSDSTALQITLPFSIVAVSPSPGGPPSGHSPGTQPFSPAWQFSIPVETSQASLSPVATVVPQTRQPASTPAVSIRPAENSQIPQPSVAAALPQTRQPASTPAVSIRQAENSQTSQPSVAVEPVSPAEQSPKVASQAISPFTPAIPLDSAEQSSSPAAVSQTSQPAAMPAVSTSPATVSEEQSSTPPQTLRIKLLPAIPVIFHQVTAQVPMRQAMEAAWISQMPNIPARLRTYHALKRSMPAPLPPAEQSPAELLPIAQTPPETSSIAQLPAESLPIAQTSPELSPITQLPAESLPIAQTSPELSPITQPPAASLPIAQTLPETSPIAQPLAAVPSQSSDTQAPPHEPDAPQTPAPLIEPSGLSSETSLVYKEDSAPENYAPSVDQTPPFVKTPPVKAPSPFLLVALAMSGIVLLAAAGISYLSAVQLHAAPNRIMAQASKKALGLRRAGTRFGVRHPDTPAIIEAPPMLSLFVKDQPVSKDRQNLHLLKAGYSLSIGGAETDDLVVSIVTIPPRIGRVRFDGKRYTFIPNKKQLLPDTGSALIQDCIGKQIRIAHKDFDIRLEIEQRENPLRNLGQFLQSVSG